MPDDPTPKPPETKGKGNFLTKEVGGLPVWIWGLVVIGGAGIAIFIIKTQQSSQASSTSQAATNAASQSVPVTSNVPDTGFAQTSLNGNNIPILPPGYQPVFDGSGNVIGYEPTPASSGNSNSSGNVTTLPLPPAEVGGQQQSLGTTQNNGGTIVVNPGKPLRLPPQPNNPHGPTPPPGSQPPERLPPQPNTERTYQINQVLG